MLFKLNAISRAEQSHGGVTMTQLLDLHLCSCLGRPVAPCKTQPHAHMPAHSWQAKWSELQRWWHSSGFDSCMHIWILACMPKCTMS